MDPKYKVGDDIYLKLRIIEVAAIATNWPIQVETDHDKGFGAVDGNGYVHYSSIADDIMTWVKVPDHKSPEYSAFWDSIELNAYYIVITNGGEWGDPDRHMWKGYILNNRLNPHIIRGRPIAIAKLVEPKP